MTGLVRWHNKWHKQTIIGSLVKRKKRSIWKYIVHSVMLAKSGGGSTTFLVWGISLASSLIPEVMGKPS
jgi:hypothetical protein